MTALSPLEDFRVRPYDPSTDEGFVLVSWTADLAGGPMLGRGGDYDLAYALVLPHVRGLLIRLRHLIRVVVPATAPEPLCAFSVLDPHRGVPVLWHLHVKGAFRSQGLMSGLLASQGVMPGDHLIAATPTRDLHSVRAKSLYRVTVRPDLLTMET